MSTLANARDVLRLMARLQRDVSVTDVATGLGVPKSSVSRTLSLMADHGFLERDPITRAYRPGALIMEASHHFRASRNAVSLLEEAAGRLVEETGYTGYVDVLDGGDSVVTHMRTGPVGTLQAYTPVGSRGPAHASSIGRAILARLDDADVTARVGSRLQRVGNSPRTHKELLSRLAQVRADGWALSRGEFVPNVAGISAAVLDPGTGQVFGIGIALPAQDLNDDRIARFGAAVRDAALTVGKSIGDPYWLAFQTSAQNPSAAR